MTETSVKPKLADLLKQHDELAKQIEAIRDQERGEALARIRSLMVDYGITTLEIEGRKRPFKPRGPRKPRPSSAQ